MPQSTILIDFERLIPMLAAGVIVISLWIIGYFIIKLALHFYINYNLGAMPSEDEIRELYRRNNEAIQMKLNILDGYIQPFMSGDYENPKE